MPRSRVSEMHQRQSPRGPPQLRTSNSDSDPFHHHHHHRPTDRSPKLGGVGGDRRSPRGTQSDPVTQKKLGSRIADLESQLGQAQVELQCLKEQLTSAEAAKKAAQEQLEKKTKKPNAIKAKGCLRNESNKKDNSSTTSPTCKIVDQNHQETDVFEVPAEPKPIVHHDEPDTKAVDFSPAVAEPESPPVDELTLKNDEIGMLKAKLEAKDKELELFRHENENLKSQLSEKFMEVSSARVKKEEMRLRLIQVQQELETTKTKAVEMDKKLEATENAKEELENEMKKLRVQTEQWRKAADAAAAILAGGVEMNGRRLSERCGSMDKHYSASNLFGPPVSGCGGYIGSPGLTDDSDDGYGGGKRKGSSGIRMFGDLWKKKGQK